MKREATLLWLKNKHVLFGHIPMIAAQQRNCSDSGINDTCYGVSGARIRDGGIFSCSLISAG